MEQQSTLETDELESKYQQLRSFNYHDAIAAGLRDCINSHGPITKNLIGSAIKRIMGQMNCARKNKGL